MSDTIKINGLLIKPKEDVLFKNLNISKRKDSDVLIEWGYFFSVQLGKKKI